MVVTSINTALTSKEEGLTNGNASASKLCPPFTNQTLRHNRNMW